VVAGQRRHHGDFHLVEADQVGVADQIVGVDLMIDERQEPPDVVQQGGVFEQSRSISP